jgi:hypothetical protein
LGLAPVEVAPGITLIALVSEAIGTTELKELPLPATRGNPHAPA